jgi:hypothetical protein
MLGRLIKILVLRGAKLNIKVYRTIEWQGGISLRFIVFEDTQRHLFIEAGFGTDVADSSIDAFYYDLEDALDAVQKLNDVTFIANRKMWSEKGAGSIDEAISKADEIWETMRREVNSLQESENGIFAPSDLNTQSNRPDDKTLQAWAFINDTPIESLSTEEEIKRISRQLLKKAKTKNIYWKLLDSTEAGRQCYRLRIDDKDEFQVP